MKRNSLRFRLVFGGLLLTLAPLVTVGLFAMNKTTSAFRQASKSQSQQMAVSLAGMVDTLVTQELKQARQMSVANTVVNTATMVVELGVDKSLGQVMKVFDHLEAGMKLIGENYETMFVTDQNGRVYADGSGGAYRELDIGEESYFKETAKTGATIARPIRSPKTGRVVFPIAVSIQSRSGKFAGAVVVWIKSRVFASRIASVKFGRTGYPFVIDQTGTVIVHPVSKFILRLNIAKRTGMGEIAKRMMAGRTGTEPYVFEDTAKVASFAPIRSAGWSLAVTQETEETGAAAVSIRNVVLAVGGFFMAFTLLLVLVFARRLANPISRSVDSLREATEQVSGASGQVSAASQQLAEGASEQASAIEQISSSLEEMAGMTRQNADSASQTDALMKETEEMIDRANRSMDALTRSIQDISKNGEETQKIIKTIDEIAFQTNLLALNAAVEAARAGEAGAGFAVVADEVRNLAMRAAEAAKNTSQLIEESTASIKTGSGLADAANAEFTEMRASTAKVTQFVGEISAASKEQAEGVEQVNQSVTQMDKVVQQTASSAEQSAAASEQLVAQAAQMKAIVADLAAMIGGDAGSGREPEAAQKTKAASRQLAETPDSPESIRRLKPGPTDRIVKPEQVIPLDDEEGFKDF